MSWTINNYVISESCGSALHFWVVIGHRYSASKENSAIEAMVLTRRCLVTFVPRFVEAKTNRFFF